MYLFKTFNYLIFLKLNLSFYFLTFLSVLRFQYELHMFTKRIISSSFFLLLNAVQHISKEALLFAFNKYTLFELFLSIQKECFIIISKKQIMESNLSVFKTHIFKSKIPMYFKNMPIYYFWYIDSFMLQLNLFFIRILKLYIY